MYYHHPDVFCVWICVKLFVCITASHRFGLNFVFQMAAYFGYSVAATDIDGDK